MAATLRLVVLLALAMAPASFSWAQGAPAASPGTASPPAAPATPTAPATPSAPAPEAAAPAPPVTEPYAYDPAGRRDPFVSLLSRGVEPTPGTKTTGLGAMTTSELTLRGVLQSRDAYVAIVAGPDGKTYRARVNDRLLDGVIRSVTPQGIVIMQEVTDPLSLVKQREVRKGLRAAENGK